MAIEGCQNKDLGKMALLQNGRIKPLYVHANETIKYLTGKTKHNGLNATQIYCQLSLSNFDVDSPRIDLPALVEHVKVKELLGETRLFREIEADYRQDIMLAMRKASEGSSEQKAFRSLLGRLNLYQSLKSGINWTAPTPDMLTFDAWEPVANIFGVIPKEDMTRAREIFLENLIVAQIFTVKNMKPSIF